jgi:hypothetical protein
MSSDRVLLIIVLAMFVLVGAGLSVASGILLEKASGDAQLRRAAGAAAAAGLKGSLSREKRIESKSVERAYGLRTSKGIQAYVLTMRAAGYSEMLRFIAVFGSDGSLKTCGLLDSTDGGPDARSWPSNDDLEAFMGDGGWNGGRKGEKSGYLVEDMRDVVCYNIAQEIKGGSAAIESLVGEAR